MLEDRPEFDSRLGTTGRFFPTEHKCNEEMERGLGEWRWMNVWYHCMNVIWNACIEKDKKNKKCGNRHQTLKNFTILYVRLKCGTLIYFQSICKHVAL